MLLQEKRYAELEPYIPVQAFPILIDEYISHHVDHTIYDALVINALRSHNISDSLDCAEGLDAKIASNAQKFCSLAKIFDESKSKRYTMSRIKRICLQTLLGITKDYSALYEHGVARLIAIKNACKSQIKHFTSVAVQNTDYADFGDYARAVAETDGIAGGIYSLITRRDGNIFWDRKLICI